MARVGLLGGTFNPPHVGHLVCGAEAMHQLGLDRIVLVPAGVPPHKEMPDDPGVEARVEMCELAVAGVPGFEVSRVEADRPGRSYTVETLRALRDASPGDELTFIVGGDMAWSLPAWREPEEILRLAVVAVAERDGLRREQIAERLGSLAGMPERLRFVDMPRLDVSSTALRRRVADGRPVRWLVPDAVAAYLADRGLYRGARHP